MSVCLQSLKCSPQPLPLFVGVAHTCSQPHCLIDASHPRPHVHWLYLVFLDEGVFQKFLVMGTNEDVLG